MSAAAAPRCVVVGAGHAAAQLCASLAEASWPGTVTLIGDEPHLPYHRPPLSKSQLDPQTPAPVQPIRPEAFYRDRGITRLTGQTVRAIDRAAREVVLDDRRIGYDTLVLSTGSTHRRPPVPGVDHPKVHVLQRAEHAQALRERLATAQSVTVIGAGFIGLEVAASLRKLGLAVTALELADRVLSRVTCPEVSAYFEALHRAQGVDLRTGVAAQSITEGADGRLTVETDAAPAPPADFVVVGAGASPNDRLAREAGLETNNGIAVDEHNQTADPAVYAIGDCCNQHHPLYGTRLRLESVQNAVDQAKTAAAAIAGQPRAHTALPWFWSDQYDVKFQIAGIAAGHDQHVLRGTPEPGQPFSVWYLKDDRLIAVDAVNDTRAYAVAGKIIPKRGRPDLGLVADHAAAPKAILQSAQ